MYIKLTNWILLSIMLYFVPRFILYNFFFNFSLIYGGLGFRGWGLISGFWGLGFQLMGFGVCGVGPSGFYRHKRITLGKNGASIIPCNACHKTNTITCSRRKNIKILY